jgi:hypothetical protein
MLVLDAMMLSAERDGETVGNLRAHALVTRIIDVRGFDASLAAAPVTDEAAATAEPLEEAVRRLVGRPTGVLAPGPEC